MNRTQTQAGSGKIERGALLCEHSGNPEKILEDLPEIRAKGYSAVEFFPLAGDERVLLPFCIEAERLGLSVWIMTGYMKYQEEYLERHPEQRLVLAGDAEDQDKLKLTWGCPYHPDFKARYLAYLRKLCRLPAVTRISLNDEAFMGNGCYCAHCERRYLEDNGEAMPRKPSPQPEDWHDPHWRNYLRWKLECWNKLHAEFGEVIHGENPAIKALFQSSPMAEFWRNPWLTGVDLSGMIEGIDGLSTDPYYTFHQRHFDPPEVYLSEWCRLLAGIVPEGKEAGIVPPRLFPPDFHARAGQGRRILGGLGSSGVRGSESHALRLHLSAMQPGAGDLRRLFPP